MNDEQMKIVREAMDDKIKKLKRELSVAEQALRTFNGEPTKR